ncbi:MAG: hypothetical protein U0R17_05485 [Acidimicrobiia bacterium]
MKKTLILFCIVLFCFGCSTSKSKKIDQGQKTITNKQAQVLSRVLYNNKLSKNALFSVVSGPFPGEGFKAKGEIDWQNGLINVSVYLLSESRPDLIAIIDFETGQVYESYFGLSDLMSKQNLEVKSWVQRKADPTTFGVDSLAQFIHKLSSDSPDNPLLIKQDGAKYLGKDKVDNVSVDKYQLGGSVTYYVTTKGDLKKVSARIKGFNYDSDFIFSGRGTVEISKPDIQNVYSLDKIGDDYLKNRPAF